MVPLKETDNMRTDSQDYCGINSELDLIQRERGL